ncbi:MAG TPA: hypothetical protein VHR18_11905 [Solirubrobacterales bacterium]|jgi:hypothetical protein|nr:hypothetical protein [Solirubrobacterales bacterium]
MNRQIKTLGAVLASALAISALSASAVPAAEFHSAFHPQTISGNSVVAHSFTTNAGLVTCKKAVLTGSTSALTASSWTLYPDYSECIAFSFINVPIHENGCGYLLYATGTQEIECPGSNKIEITFPFCTLTVGPQHLGSGVTFTNNAGKTDIIQNVDVTGELDYNECGTFRTNGTYGGKTTWTGGSGSIWYE